MMVTRDECPSPVMTLEVCMLGMLDMRGMLDMEEKKGMCLDDYVG